MTGAVDEGPHKAPPPPGSVTSAGAMLFETGATAAEARAALLAEQWPGSDLGTILTAHEAPEGWRLLLRVPAGADGDWARALADLAPSGGGVEARPEPREDWLALAEAGLPPVDVGRFHLHAGRAAKPRPGQWPLRLDAGRAFGTGRHDTTRGILLLMQRHARRARARHVADIGTGSGVLAFAALRLWPRARVVAGEIDAAALATARRYARWNGMVAGDGPGRLRLVRATGLGARAFAARTHDLILANILAEPLGSMAPALAASVARGGRVALAGLLAHQAGPLLARMRAAGLVREAMLCGPWPILLLRQDRSPPGPAARLRRALAGRAPVRASTPPGRRARPADACVL